MLEVSFPSPVNQSVLDNFYLLVNSDGKFQTINELNSNQESILNSIRMNYNSVPVMLRDNVAAVKLFDYPADYDERFEASVQNLTSQLSSEIDKPFYYQSAFSQPAMELAEFDFIVSRVSVRKDSIAASAQVLLFEPSGNVSKSMKMLETILNQSHSFPESIIIIPAEWFLSRMNTSEAFSTVIDSYLNGNSISFPMPASEPESPSVNWPIIFLIIIWASFLIHYKYQPMYATSLPRYFFNHSFFINDIREKRIRSSMPCVVILLQHTLLTGFFFFLIADAFISEAGLQSLAAHYPIFFYPGLEKLWIFGIGLLFAFVSQMISVAWLHLFNKNLQYVNQTINLYSWPLHINLLIVTLLVYFVQLSNSQNWLIVAVAAYVFVWFFSFTIAAIDGAKFLEKYRALYLFLTIGIHTLLNAAAIVLIFWLPFIYEPLEMAFLLP